MPSDGENIKTKIKERKRKTEKVRKSWKITLRKVFREIFEKAYKKSEFQGEKETVGEQSIWDF